MCPQSWYRTHDAGTNITGNLAKNNGAILYTTIPIQ